MPKAINVLKKQVCLNRPIFCEWLICHLPSVVIILMLNDHKSGKSRQFAYGKFCKKKENLLSLLKIVCPFHHTLKTKKKKKKKNIVLIEHV